MTINVSEASESSSLTASSDLQQCARHEVPYGIVLLVDRETRPALLFAAPHVLATCSSAQI